MDQADVIGIMSKEIKRARGLRRWARAIELSPSYVSRVVRGEKEIGDSILNALGLERVTSYRKRGTNGRS